MKSPKYTFDHQQLSTVLSRAQLSSKWNAKTRKELRLQFLPDPFDFYDWHFSINAKIKEITARIEEGNYIPGKPQIVLSEKSKGLCRQLVIGRPEDILILQVLSDSFYARIKESQPSKNAFFEPNDHTFISGPFSEREYGSLHAWKNFQKQILSFTKENKYIIITDIANYYDFINYDHLRNILVSLQKIPEIIINLLIYVLSRLSWDPDFMPRTNIGLPQMNIDAPRVLAHAMLFELDKLAEQNAFGNYARFMDDIDIGVETMASGRRVLRDIDLALQSRSLRLNSGKTKILTSEQAVDHYCARENNIISRLANAYSRDLRNNKPVERHAIRVEKLYHYFNGNKFEGIPRFARGNGEKVLKRIITTSHKIGYELPDRELLGFIRNNPNLRGTAFRTLSHRLDRNEIVEYICKYIISDDVIDDLTVIEASKYLVSTRIKNRKQTTNAICEAVYTLKDRGSCSLYSALWIGSKYVSVSTLFELVSQSMEKWRSNFWCGRLVGALFARFRGTQDIYSDYFKLIKRAENAQASSTHKSCFELSTDLKEFRRYKAYLSAPNGSLPLKIYHGKVLLLKCATFNQQANNELRQIITKHNLFRSDPFYGRLFRAY